MKLLNYTLILLFSSLGASAQVIDIFSWKEIENSIRSKTHLEETLREVSREKEKFAQAGDDLSFSRCWYYTMLIRDLKTEDSLYFKNSSFIDSLLSDKKSSAQLKNVLHLMQARRLLLFDQKNLKFKRSTYGKKELNPNYGAMSVPQRDSLIRYHFDRAAQMNIPLRKKDDIKWLSSDAAKLLFKADLADIAFAERIGFESRKAQTLRLSPADLQQLISCDASRFLTTLPQALDSSHIDSKLMQTYLAWMDKHRQDTEKVQYIQLLIKYYLYTQRSAELAEAWASFLTLNVSSALETVRATSAFYLFQYYYYQGIQYGRQFETRYKGQLEQAVQLYTRHQDVLGKFPIYKEELERLLKKIKAAEMDISMNDLHMSANPIMLTLRYRNAQKFNYRIVKIGVNEVIPSLKPERIRSLMAKSAVRDSSINLPSRIDDHDKHALYLKLDSLPLGMYNLVFSDAEITDKDSPDLLDYMEFQVSNLSAVNAADRFIVLNRKTGFPIKDVQVRATYKIRSKNAASIAGPVSAKLFKSDKMGFVATGMKEAEEIMLISGIDTLLHDFRPSDNDLPYDSYNTEDYDDLDEFYDEHAQLRVYTDRGIYRPGQKVQYKVVLLTKDAVTGQYTIFSKANNKYFKKWLSENEPFLELRDPNHRLIDSIRLEPDHYGSFSGTFLIPKNALTGNWSIAGDLLDSENSDFQVEEYKRPTMEMTMEKPVDTPLPGEPFELKLKVKSLSGAELNRVKIAYQVSRGHNFQSLIPASKPKLMDSVGYTNEKGELVIRIDDSYFLRPEFQTDEDRTVSYSLKAIATESTGESTSLDDNYAVSSWPVKISIPAAAQYNRKDLPKLNMTAKFENTKYKVQAVKVSIYRQIPVPDTAQNQVVDQWLYTKAQLPAWFVDDEFRKNVRMEKKLVLEKTIGIDSIAQFELDKQLLTSGSYELVAATYHLGKISGQTIIGFKVFDTEERSTPGEPDDFNYLPVNYVHNGERLSFYSATSDSAYVVYGMTYYIREKKGIALKNSYHIQYQAKGMQVYKFKIPEGAIGSLLLTKVYVKHNQLHKNSQMISLKPIPAAVPEIIVEKYRKVLAPGTKETFSVSIKTGKDNIAAQLMTGMYDAALDKLSTHNWAIPQNRRHGGYPRGNWSDAIKRTASSYNYTYSLQDGFINEYEQEQNNLSQTLVGRMPGLAATSGDNRLDEVVVVAYERTVRTGSTSSVISLRGYSSLKYYAQPLTIIDGVPYTGDIRDFNAELITEGIVLKGADAIALYGARAAQGVLIISTKGKIVLPGSAEQPQAIVRKDFNETAFFYPKLYADKNGLYTFSFSMPQTATQWNWKLLAHTQKGAFAYAERKISTRLNLMVQPNMPRLLYQGDEIVLKSRVSNLDTAGMNLVLSCSIEDAVTGEELTKKLLAGDGRKTFVLAAKQTGAEGFAIKVPEGQLNPLKIVTTVSGGGFADAEEHTLPILPKKMFLRKQVPLVFSEKDSVVKAPQLPSDAEIYGMSLQVDAKPQAALLNSLPFLANYSYDCAEQTFNKLFAHLTALQLMRSEPELRKSFNRASVAPKAVDSTSRLPDEIAEAAMPWLNLGNQTIKQQTQLYQLLDTLSNKKKIAEYLQKLYAMQDKVGGGIPWFEGGRSNLWISNYILKGFGKLDRMGWQAAIPEIHSAFIKKLIAYVDNSAFANAGLFNAYSRSFWKADYPLDAQAREKLKSNLKQTGNRIGEQRLYERALWVIVALSYFDQDDELHRMAIKQLKDLQQLAIKDEQNGLRWKEIADNSDLDHSKEETIAMLYEAFSMGAQEKAITEGLTKWILNNRQDYGWRSTVGTAAAIDIIRNSKASGVHFEADSVFARIAGQQLNSSNGFLSGQSKQFLKLNNPSEARVSANRMVKGGLTWYYFSAEGQPESLSNGVKLGKTLLVYDQQKKVWVPVTEKSFLKLGDKVKIVLTVETDVNLRFVQLEDKRAAVFEPVDGSSGHQYQNGVHYYRSVRDAGQQLFIDFLPRGRTEFSYEVMVTQEGKFRNGPAVLQCLYNPGVTAYSNSMIVGSH